MSWFDFDDSRKNKNKKLANVTPTNTNQANSNVNSSADNHGSDTLLLLKLHQTNCYITLNLCLRTVNNISVQAVNSHIQECWAMAASSSAVSDQASTAIGKNVNTQQAESLQQAIHIPGSINQRNSHCNSAPLLPSPVSSLQNLTNNASADLSSTNYNCANCDIKFDSESSLRVHLQVSSIVSISIIIYHSTTVQ